MQNALEKWERKKMTDKAETIVWEKNTETNEVEKVSLKVVVGQLNQFVYDNEVGVEYFINRKDIKWAKLM